MRIFPKKTFEYAKKENVILRFVQSSNMTEHQAIPET